MSDSCAIPRGSSNEAISWVWRTRVNEWSIHRPGDFNSEIYPLGYVLLYPVFTLTNLKKDYFVTNWLEFDTHETGYFIMKLSGCVLALIFISVAQVRTVLTFNDISETCLIEN